MSFFQNQNRFTVAVPTASGVDVNLDYGQAVEGDIYAIFAYDNLLTLVAGPFVWPVLQYAWPGSSGGGGGSSITAVLTSDPLTGGGSSGTLTIGLAALGITGTYIADGTITSDKLATGAAVTGLTIASTTLTDSITLIAGTDIILTPDSGANTITIGVDSTEVISSVTGTLPISVVTTDGAAVVSVAVTPTNNGGAVALQSLSSNPTLQAGTACTTTFYTADYVAVNMSYDAIQLLAAASSLYAQAASSSDNVFSFFSDAAVLTTYLTAAGTLYTTNLSNSGTATTSVFSLISDPWTVATTEKAHLTAVGADSANNFLNIPISLCNTLTLTQVASSPTARIGNGLITGSPTLAPLIQFATTSDFPAISLGTTSVAETDVALEVLSNGATPRTIGLFADGTITCKRVNAQFNTESNIVLTAGSYAVVSYPGVNTFIIDSSAGVSSISLPTLDSTSEDGVIYTFKKYDITTNAVLISASGGQTIDNTLTQYTLTAYKQTFAYTTDTPPIPILHTLRVMSVVKPLTSQYFWISL